MKGASQRIVDLGRSFVRPTLCFFVRLFSLCRYFIEPQDRQTERAAVAAALSGARAQRPSMEGRERRPCRTGSGVGCN